MDCGSHETRPCRSRLLRREAEERQRDDGVQTRRARSTMKGIALTTQPTVARSPWKPPETLQVDGRIAVDLDRVRRVRDADRHRQVELDLRARRPPARARSGGGRARARPGCRRSPASRCTGSIVSVISSIGRPRPSAMIAADSERPTCPSFFAATPVEELLARQARADLRAQRTAALRGVDDARHLDAGPRGRTRPRRRAPAGP